MKNNLSYLLLLSIAIGSSGCIPKKDKGESKKTTSNKRKDTKNKGINEDVEELELVDEMDENFFVEHPGKTSTKSDDFAWVDAEKESNPNEILFDFDRDKIRPDQKTTVAKASAWAKNVTNKGGNVVVEGHSDAIGARDYNLALSERRAKTVAHELIHEGTPKDNVKIVGRGQEILKVIAPLTATEQQPNRRVAIYEVK